MLEVAVMETHQCVHTRVPVDRKGCLSLCSITARNHGGCSEHHCTSEWRICRVCVTAAEKDRSTGLIDPVSGLCVRHGGKIASVREAVLEHIELSSEVKVIPVDQVSPLPNQPRKHFDTEKLQSLAESIRHRGQIQPGLVVKTPNGPLPYELRDGERRLRACALAGVPFRAMVQTSTDGGANEALLTSAVANFNREGHTPWEEIDLVVRLLRPCPDTGLKYSGIQVAESLGKSSFWISTRKTTGERLTRECLEYIREHTVIPFSIIKEVADLPLDEQLMSLMEYVEGKVKMPALKHRAGNYRKMQGRARARKPSDTWVSGRDVARTVMQKVEYLTGILTPEAIERDLKELIRQNGQPVIQLLESSVSELQRCIRLMKLAQCS
jgi:ParB/RepB/Spo0J family partition protein